MPTVNVYTNILGDTKLSLVDKADLNQLPDFIIGNGIQFIKAHKYSNMSNNLTIRLDDVKLNNNTLELHTSRSYYYHMLLTNRCMDYQLDNGMSVRGIYEFADKVSLLKESKLSNQIGINGLIITKDGYLLFWVALLSCSTLKNNQNRKTNIMCNIQNESLRLA